MTECPRCPSLFAFTYILLWASHVAYMVKNMAAMQETRLWSLGLGRSLGEGNGNPLQYSCQENSMDIGASQATVHGIAESDTTEQLTHILNPHTNLHYPHFTVEEVSAQGLNNLSRIIQLKAAELRKPKAIGLHMLTPSTSRHSSQRWYHVLTSQGAARNPGPGAFW